LPNFGIWSFSCLACCPVGLSFLVFRLEVNMKKLIVCVSFAFLLAGQCSSATVSDSAYANMQRAMNGILSKVAVSRGFTSTDPRIYNTLYGMGAAATTAAATAGAGLLIGGTAPAWGTVLGVAAISGGVSYAVALGADALYKWAFGAPAATPITMTTPIAGNAGTITIDSSGQLVTAIVGNSINQPYTTITKTGANYYTQTWYSTATNTNPGAGTYSLSQTASVSGVTYWLWVTPTTASTSPCPSGYNYISSPASCQNLAAQVQTALQTLSQAINKISTAQAAQKVNADTLAMIVNYLWAQAAAQPNYAGLPYSASQPVTAADVNNFASTSPDSMPTVGALVAPVPSGSNGFLPSTSPSPSVAVSPATSPNSPSAVTPGGSAAEINLGSDPGTPAPTLENTPAATDILAPLLSVMPDIRGYAVPSHSGVCPAPVIDVMFIHTTWNQHCTFIEQFRTQIYATFLAAWLILALVIVLTA